MTLKRLGATLIVMLALSGAHTVRLAGAGCVPFDNSLCEVDRQRPAGDIDPHAPPSVESRWGDTGSQFGQSNERCTDSKSKLSAVWRVTKRIRGIVATLQVPTSVCWSPLIHRSPECASPGAPPSDTVQVFRPPRVS